MAHRLARVERSPVVVGNPLPSVISVALLAAALGGVLAYRADWAGTYVLTGLAGYAIVSAIVVVTAGLGRGRAGFGIANQVTLLRAGLVCLASGALLAGGPSSISGWSLAALVATALSLDAVDGWLARRLTLASGFGARFDLEIDALLILVLALLVWQSGRVGPWVLAIGLLRYVFVLTSCYFPALRGPLSAEPATTGGMRAAGRVTAGLPAAAGREPPRERERGAGVACSVGVLCQRHHLSGTHRKEPDGDRSC